METILNFSRYKKSKKDIANSWLINVPNTTDCIFHKNPDWSGPTSRSANTIPSDWKIVDWVQ